MSLLIFENVIYSNLYRVHSGLVSVDAALRFFKPVEVLLLEYEAIWSFTDEVIVFTEVRILAFHLSQDLKPSSEVSLLDLMLAILVIFVGKLIDHSLPFLEKLGGAGDNLYR